MTNDKTTTRTSDEILSAMETPLCNALGLFHALDQVYLRRDMVSLSGELLTGLNRSLNELAAVYYSDEGQDYIRGSSGKEAA